MSSLCFEIAATRQSMSDRSSEAVDHIRSAPEIPGVEIQAKRHLKRYDVIEATTPAALRGRLAHAGDISEAAALQ